VRALVGFILGCALVGACAAQSAPRRANQTWVLSIEAAHVAADRETDPRRARAELAAALAREAPSDVSASDRRRILQDLRFRVAVLSLQLGDNADAVRQSQQGLELGADADEFAANLWIVRGRAEAKLGRAGDAAAAYSRAMSIHERLMDDALRGPL